MKQLPFGVRTLTCVVLVALTMTPEPACAEGAALDLTGDNSSFHADAEVDPLAYGLKGYSVHVGVGYERLRVDLGAFALDLPGFMEPSKGFETSNHGFGLKLQYFPFAEQRGGFIGIDVIALRTLIEDKESNAARRDMTLNLGVHVGWRFALGAGFYVTPWVGVLYDPMAKKTALAGKTYRPPAFAPTATLHIGYRFR